MARQLIGTPFRLDCSFYQDDDLADPGTVTCSVRKPDGSVVNVDSGDIVHPGLGEFYTIFTDTDLVGTYTATWVGNGGTTGQVKFYTKAPF